MSSLAIIPARGGSRRVPRKNIRDFCGQPMIAWSIQCARRSGLFDRIVVSTDDAEIMAVARDYGAEAPFVRPPELADDHATTLAVIRHAVEWLGRHGAMIDRACCIYATAPFLSEEKLREGNLALQRDPSLDFALSVSRFDSAVFRAVGLDADNRVRMFWPEHEMTRSQDLPASFHDAGQFYWGTRDAWLTKERIFSSRTSGIVVPSSQMQDIDTEDDWVLAELKFKELHPRKHSPFRVSISDPKPKISHTTPKCRHDAAQSNLPIK